MLQFPNNPVVPKEDIMSAENTVTLLGDRSFARTPGEFTVLPKPIGGERFTAPLNHAFGLRPRLSALRVLHLSWRSSFPCPTAWSLDNTLFAPLTATGLAAVNSVQLAAKKTDY